MRRGVKAGRCRDKCRHRCGDGCEYGYKDGCRHRCRGRCRHGHRDRCRHSYIHWVASAIVVHGHPSLGHQTRGQPRVDESPRN